MTFRLENNLSRKIPYLVEFEETPRFWYSCVARDAWINFSSMIVEFRPSKSQENPHFLSFSFFLSLSIRFFLSPLFPTLPFFIFFSPFLSFPYPLHFLLSLFVTISFFFSFSIFPFFFSFSLIFLFLISPPSSFSYPYGSSEGNFPSLSSLETCHHHVFLPYFLYFPFPFYYIM